MSNHNSAVLGAAQAAPAAPVRKASSTKPSIWRRMFDAWIRSYANRLDPEGNVIL